MSPKSLKYTIAYASPHSADYAGEKIMVDDPADQRSRWSTAETPTATSKQWITLKLDSVSIVSACAVLDLVLAHPCNLKDFRVYVGMSEDKMTEVLAGSLKNDSIRETFSLRHKNKSGITIPSLYVKILPLSPHQGGFHFSIWHVALLGINDPQHIVEAEQKWKQHLETQALSIMLKHLRQRRLLTPFQSILERTGLLLEHPLVSELYDLIVLQGNWLESEQLLERMANARLFDDCLRSFPPTANWTRLTGTNADGDVPHARGGHAMCIDSTKGLIYMFGGFDGKKSLDDFWSYDIHLDQWTLLCASTAAVNNAPDARACHKMVFDTKTGSIYVFGRLGDVDNNIAGTDTAPPRSEFYRYHTRGADKGHWDYLAMDTSSSGGPPLIFDHQMVIDSDAQMLYVFGGKVVEERGSSNVKYSGFYSFNVRTNRWSHLSLADSAGKVVTPRFGHSMLLDPMSRTIYIFAGQRNDQFLADMHAYHIDTKTTTEIFSNFAAAGGPSASFTQRAVIDPQLKEIYVFCGLIRPGHAGAQTTTPTEPTWIFRYDSKPGTWVSVMRPTAYVGEPLARYAHQAVYDLTTKTMFIHAGNAGPAEGSSMERDVEGDGASERRLDDIWRMNLVRYAAPEATELIRRAKFKIRQQRFREMSETEGQIQALGYLQNDVSNVVDHADSEETDVFRSLLTHLMTPSLPISEPETPPSDRDLSPRKKSRPNTPEDAWTSEIECALTPRLTTNKLDMLDALPDPLERRENADAEMDAERFRQRTQLFEAILEYVDADAKQPDKDLVDLVDL
ncbi:hypothetical protein CYLTODRAFT_342854 [Cylindrobasidium torrendii FP15055 ss-10]|uniref:Muskelin N-terminal domain-containing protein n=1 Tax=Cylindrobasidium torrendii FP15055 ss-10 TaxID=1314674 RepID=A0A0D7BR42_9AGAR|nr:hypothetical protein CYLTODRAFT_342854 [Cylindrobasidium torrendii FP15055 ss-10]